MPSFETARRIASMKNNGAKTIGQVHKENSDFLMEQTWDSDVQSKTCYIYDYFHDNQSHLNIGMTYENTTKTKIDAKFIVTKYNSLDKDQVEYHLMFKPSQKTRFEEGDELYYFEEYRKRYHNDDFVGLFVDIPDEKGIYRKWLIIQREEGNQFIKYLILPCNFYMMWLENNGQERIKRKMWCVLRSQSSYNSGIYSYYATTKMENQEKCWIPLNSITEKIWYTSDESKNMRVLVGALTEHPIAWIVSKVENVNPTGIQKITFYQSEFNSHTDYVNFETGEMFADYYDSNIEPTDPLEDSTTSAPVPLINYGKITASTSTIKIGGSYKTLTITIFNEEGVDITDSYSDALFDWTCTIDTVELTTSDVITWLDGTTFNKKKIKFSKNKSYLGKILDVGCKVTKDSEIIETSMQFELIV